jgi:hypothetical protein
MRRQLFVVSCFTVTVTHAITHADVGRTIIVGLDSRRCRHAGEQGLYA